MGRHPPGLTKRPFRETVHALSRFLTGKLNIGLCGVMTYGGELARSQRVAPNPEEESIMRRVLSRVSRSVAVLALLVGGAGRAGAGPLNPLDFPLSDSGVFPTAAGTYTFDTSGLAPTLSGPGGTVTGVLYSDVPGHQIAVFDFNSITVSGGQVLVGPSPFVTSSAPPLALLSRSDVTIDGVINVSAPQPVTPVLFSPGGPGGFGSDRGPGAGGGGGESADWRVPCPRWRRFRRQRRERRSRRLCPRFSRPPPRLPGHPFWRRARRQQLRQLGGLASRGERRWKL